MDYQRNNTDNIYSLLEKSSIYENYSHIKSCNLFDFYHNALMRTHQYRDIICDTCTCRHLSADDIFDEVRIREPQIGRATVYRNIESMAEQGILRRFPGINGKTYYECNDETHAHLVDEKTGIFCDFAMDNIAVKNIPEGYKISEIRIQITKDI
jgi:Fe2+ or Zn2+ uptake regulation protein